MFTAPACPQPVMTTRPTATDIDDEGLVVEDQGVGLPAMLAVRLVGGKAVLEVGRAVDLAGDQQAVVEEDRWLTPLDHREPLAF